MVQWQHCSLVQVIFNATTLFRNSVLTFSMQGPVGGDEHDGDEDAEFNMNVGRAMDYLAVDVPHMFSAPPRLEIFSSNVVLKVSAITAYSNGWT